MSHVLDTPIWSALTTSHSALARGAGGALRYPAEVSPFAAVADDAPATLAALASLVLPGETIVLVRRDPIVLPDALTAVSRAQAVQLASTQALAPSDDPRLERLGERDEPEMYDLAMLTRPGPFARRSMRLGRFWGIRQNGRLVAMAGERLAQGGWTELSGVCTHPEARGQGLARLLSTHVAAHIAAQGEQPYLHAYAGNAAAIGLYESLGFRTRATMNVVVAQRN
jgi:predicted GNAT family acetyltransferase